MCRLRAFIVLVAIYATGVQGQNTNLIVTYPTSFQFGGTLPPRCPVCPATCPLNPTLTEAVQVIPVCTDGTCPASVTISTSYPNNNIDTKLFIVTPGVAAPYKVTFNTLGSEGGVDIHRFYHGALGSGFNLFQTVSGNGAPGKFGSPVSTFAVVVQFISNCQNVGYYSYTICVGTTC